MSSDEDVSSLESIPARLFSRPTDEGARADALSLQVLLLDHQDSAAGIMRLREWALTKASPKEGDAVVDVGSGTGTMCSRFAGLVGPSGSVTGVEPNASLRAVALGRLGSTAVSIVDGTAEQLPFGDASVNFLWCERVLQHVSDAQAALGEFYRNDTDSLNLKSGPPLRPWNCWPPRVKSTVRTMLAGPDGVSAGERQTASTWLSGSSVA
ncbi:MAG: methyltransferase domain-containing protein [Dermatophilaceae bacterium]